MGRSDRSLVLSCGETLCVPRCVTLQRLLACARAWYALPISPLPFEPCVGILEATSGRCRGRGPLIQMTDLRNKGVVQ